MNRRSLRWWRPPTKTGHQTVIDHGTSHLLALSHAGVDHLIGSRLGHRRRNRLARPIALAVVKQGALVAAQEVEELARSGIEVLEAIPETCRIRYDYPTQHYDTAQLLSAFSALGCQKCQPSFPTISVSNRLVWYSVSLWFCQASDDLFEVARHASRCGTSQVWSGLGQAAGGAGASRHCRHR